MCTEFMIDFAYGRPLITPSQEGFKMVNAAIHVANKLPDIGIQLWATALLKGVANLHGNAQDETRWFAEHDHYSQVVIAEHVRASSAPEHRLIEVRCLLLRKCECSIVIDHYWSTESAAMLTVCSVH